MNKCNNMLLADGKGEVPQNSFRQAILQQRKANLDQQLNQLMVFEEESKIESESRSDMEELP